MSDRRQPDLARWNFSLNADGHLVLGGCDAVDLARRFGTPLHVVDEARLKGAVSDFRATLSAALGEVQPFYSYKTNCVPGVLRLLHAEGVGAESISPYETWLAIRLGLPGDRILYNGVNKSLEGLRLAAAHGVRSINIDSLDEVERLRSVLDAARAPLRVGVRVSTGAGWKAQFGVEVQSGEALEVFRRLHAIPQLVLSGIHVHLGTSIESPDVYVAAARAMMDLRAAVKQSTGAILDHLDLGGGFPVPTVREFGLWDTVFHKRLRRPARPPDPRRPGLAAFAERIGATLRARAAIDGLPVPAVFVEPGRALTSQAQVLLLSVGVVKRRADGSRIAICDGGRSTCAAPLGNEYHELILANRARDPGRVTHTIVGGLCTPGDWTYVRKDLPELAPGDLLAVMDAGAYFTSFANDFAFPRPAVVLASAGQARVLRRRESYEALIAMDEEPAPPRTA